MKTLLLSTTLVALALGALPAAADVGSSGSRIAGTEAFAGPSHDVFDRRGRGRGRGGDDHRSGEDRGGRDDKGSGSGRDRPRIPGGSGCDDPGDVAEHPECRV